MLSSAISISPQSDYAKEVVKWEAHHTQYGPPGRPYVYAEYPAMMYRATRDHATGKVSYESQTVGDTTERERAERVGFVFGGQGKAFEKLEAQEFEIAELAANRAFNDRKLSPEAQAEAERIDQSTGRHLAEIPAERIAPRRGRPPLKKQEEGQ